MAQRGLVSRSAPGGVRSMAMSSCQPYG
jgi:hypothetical protein